MADDFDALLGQMQAEPQQASQVTTAPADGGAEVTLPEQSVTTAPQPEAAPVRVNGNELDSAGQLGGAIVTGAAEAVFQTKDFIFGAPKEDEKSGLRRASEGLRGDLNKASMVNSFVGTLSQFAVGMLGAGKFISAAKMVPGVAAGLGAAGETAVGIGQAAGVGAVAFDPNGERLSNLVQSYPALQNPVSQFLAAQPGDSAALGRAKNALESIGMDLATIGVFTATMRAYKGLRAGDHAEVQAAATEIQAAQQQQSFDATHRVDPVAAATEHPELAAAKAIEQADGAIKEQGNAAVQAQRQTMLDAGQDGGKVHTLTDAQVAAHTAADEASPLAQDVLEHAVGSAEGKLTFKDMRAATPSSVSDAELMGAVKELQDKGLVAASQYSDPKSIAGGKALAMRFAPGGDDFHLLRVRPEARKWDRGAGAADQAPEGLGSVREPQPEAGPYNPNLENVPFGGGQKIRPKGLAEDGSANLNGLNYSEGPNGLYISGSYLAEAHRGKGHGLAMYEELAQLADVKGKPVYSDYDVSSEAVKVYEKLKAKGYDVEYAPKAQVDTTGEVAGFKGKMVGDDEAGYTIRINPRGEREPVATGAPNTEPTLAAQEAAVPPREAAGAVQNAASQTAVDANSVTRVDNPTQAGAPQRTREAIQISDADVQSLITKGGEDAVQLFGPGGWEGAIERGYVFGQDRINFPWQKVARTTDNLEPYDFMVARIAEDIKSGVDRVRGGNAEGVMTDVMVDRAATSYLKAYNMDPEATRGLLAQAGKDAVTMAAKMEAGFILSQRRNMDLLNLKTRIQLGSLEEYGGDLAAATAHLREIYEEAANLQANALAIRASGGRVVRRMREEFAVTFEDMAAVKGLSDEQFLGLLDAPGRDPAVLAKMMKPGLLSTIKDTASYLYVNNLLWGLRTHFVNLTTNTFQLLGRPAQRLIGYAGREVYDQGRAALGLEARVRQQSAASGVREAWSQYGYLGTSINEAFTEAQRAWTRGDSIMSPHSSEVQSVGQRGAEFAGVPYKPMDSVPNVLANAYLGLMKGLGLPTRALGFSDEFSKQLVYRSKIQSRAFAEGVDAGLEGQALTDHVKKALLDGFDDQGRAVDLPALHEANIATFQQDLLSSEDTSFGPIGKLTQQFVGNVPLARFVLPFVKTPINVVREGAKLTPGLNMVQKEYRQMIGGSMGEEMQAQAIGQMAMGSMFLGTAAMLAHSGYVTGGGPSDPNARAQLQATGWQPYSFILPQADGSKKYVNFGRYDPVALPFGIVADIIDVVEREQDGDTAWAQVQNGAAALAIAMAKQFSSKTYLQSLNGVVEALSSPDKGGGVEKLLGTMAANFVPGSSALRQLNQDETLRDARSITDRILTTIPGLSNGVPAKRDVFGDPVYVHKGLWVDGSTNAVDQEIARYVDEQGQHFGPPNPSPSGGTDLRDITLSTGRNAFDYYQELAGHPKSGPSLKEAVAKVMATPGYAKLPDGGSDTKGTKQYVVAGIISQYRNIALRQVNADPVMRQQLHDRLVKARAALITQQTSGQPQGQSPLDALRQYANP